MDMEKSHTGLLYQRGGIKGEEIIGKALADMGYDVVMTAINQKGYDLTERMFELLRLKFPNYKLEGPERAGRDILLGEIFPDYPKPNRPADFVIKKDGVILAVGFARYDSDRGGAQEDDRTGGYHQASRELLEYALGKELRTKVIFVNDGPGLLLGSMWDDYSYLEEVSDDILVVTLRMIVDRITEDWLNH